MSTPEISRRQAWCKLAVFIADGLPDPIQVDFFADDGIAIKLDSAEALKAWAERFAMRPEPRQRSTEGTRWIYTASTASSGKWFGWYITLTAYPPRVSDVEPAAAGMSSVRALAEAAADVAPVPDAAPEEVAAGVAATAATSAAPRYPRFAPDAVLIVDMHNGHEQWTGAEWNGYVESAERNKNMVTARLIECPPPVSSAPPFELVEVEQDPAALDDLGVAVTGADEVAAHAHTYGMKCPIRSCRWPLDEPDADGDLIAPAWVDEHALADDVTAGDVS